jgi:hypothetical protein
MDPVAKGWVRAAIDLWCRLRKVPRDSLLGSAVRESLAQYIRQQNSMRSLKQTGGHGS